MEKAFVFDMDGVLFDTERFYMEAWREVAAEQNLGDMELAVQGCVGMNKADTKKFFEEHYGPEFPFDSYMQAASERYTRKVETEGLPIMKGAVELLEYLKAENYRIGLASSTRLVRVLENLDRAGFRDYFEVVVAGDMVESGKPSPDIYLLACSKLGVNPAETYAVEDSPNGIRSANSAGMKVIMVPDMISPTLELEKLLFALCRDLTEVKYMLMGENILRIPFQGLSNTRDLGGFPAGEGRKIRQGRLLRSGALIWGSEQDQKVLLEEYGLTTVIDFRTETERLDKPDPEWPGVSNIWNPILQEAALGITREEENTEQERDVIKEVLRSIGTKKSGVEEYMRSMYSSFIKEPYSKAQYKKFFEVLLEQKEGAVLWHCSAGKDRAGMATALLLSALDVPRDFILADYMRTNVFGKEDVTGMLDKIKNRFGSMASENEEVLNSIRLFFTVEAAYLAFALEQIESEYGNMESFLEKEMGLEPEKRKRLQELYLS